MFPHVQKRGAEGRRRPLQLADSRNGCLVLTVMELLSCLTLCSSCSRSSFSSELHFISFCFSSSLATKHTQCSRHRRLFAASRIKTKEREITFFVSDVGMDNSQRSGPGNGFFFFQNLQRETRSCHKEKPEQAAALRRGRERASNGVMDVRCYFY